MAPRCLNGLIVNLSLELDLHHRQLPRHAFGSIRNSYHRLLYDMALRRSLARFAESVSQKPLPLHEASAALLPPIPCAIPLPSFLFIPLRLKVAKIVPRYPSGSSTSSVRHALPRRRIREGRSVPENPQAVLQNRIRLKSYFSWSQSFEGTRRLITHCILLGFYLSGSYTWMTFLRVPQTNSLAAS